MKNGKFLAGLFTGLAAGAVVLILMAHRPAPESHEAPLPQYSSRITSLTSDTHVYRLTVDNVQYIVVASANGGAAITRHK